MEGAVLDPGSWAVDVKVDIVLSSEAFILMKAGL